MKIRTQLSTSAQSVAAKQAAEPAAGGQFAAMLQDLEPEAAPVGAAAPTDSTEDDESSDDETAPESIILQPQAEMRPTQAPLRVTLYWNTQPTDPRSASVRMTGSTDPTPHTLTTRESGFEARGLRSGAVPPGGAGTDSTPASLGTESDSREVPPPTGTSQSHGGISPVAAAAEAVEASVDVVELAAEPDDAAATAAQRTDARARVDATAADTAAVDDAAAPDDAFDLDALDLDAPEPGAPRADVSAGAKAESTSTPSSTRLEPTVEAPTDPADVPDLPPRTVGDGPVRVAIDDDLAVEVTADDAGIDVTLEGDADAVRPLHDVGPELEEELARNGWDLRQFGSRKDRQAETTQHHVGAAVVDEEIPSDTPANRVLRRGKLVDTLA